MKKDSIDAILRSKGYVKTSAGVWVLGSKWPLSGRLNAAFGKKRSKKKATKKVSKKSKSKKVAAKKVSKKSKPKKVTAPRRRVSSTFEQWLKEQGYTKGRSGWLSPDKQKFFPL